MTKTNMILYDSFQFDIWCWKLEFQWTLKLETSNRHPVAVLSSKNETDKKHCSVEKLRGDIDDMRIVTEGIVCHP